jgi:hypothetical protein
METRLTVIDRVPADDPRALLDRVSRLVPPRPPATGVAMPPLPAFHLRSAPSARPKTRCRSSPWSSVPRQYRTPSNSPTKPAHGRITLGGLLIVAEPASEIYRPVHALASI